MRRVGGRPAGDRCVGAVVVDDHAIGSPGRHFLDLGRESHETGTARHEVNISYARKSGVNRDLENRLGIIAATELETHILEAPLVNPGHQPALDYIPVLVEIAAGDT